MQILLEIPENRYAFFKALIRMLSFPKIIQVREAEQEVPLVSKAEFFAGLKESFEQMRLHQQGKIELRNADDVLAELEKTYE